MLAALAGGGELNTIPKTVIDVNQTIMQTVTVGQGAGIAWPALLRKLDRMDEGYKT